MPKIKASVEVKSEETSFPFGGDGNLPGHHALGVPEAGSGHQRRALRYAPRIFDSIAHGQLMVQTVIMGHPSTSPSPSVARVQPREVGTASPYSSQAP